MNIPYVMKKCSKCGRWLVANTDNFNRAKKGKYGLKAICKKCRKQYRENNKDKKAEYDKQYRETNKDKIAERKKQYRENNKDKIAEISKRYRENNKEKLAEYKKQWYEANRDKMLEQRKQYYKNNPEYYKQYRETNKEKIAEQRKQRYEANREKELERNKQYYETNKDKISERHKRYRQSPQGQVAMFNKNQRRRTKEEQQGTGITKDQWLEMMSFFDWKCAYSGEVLSKDTRSIDHIVPLNSGGNNMIWNCVPMLRSLNSSKNSKDMLEWYKEQDCYSEARLAKIYEWQEYARKKWKN